MTEMARMGDIEKAAAAMLAKHGIVPSDAAVSAMIAFREQALKEAVSTAALYIINKIHPDVAAGDMAPDARMIAHTTCQYVADAINELCCFPVSRY